MKHRFIWLLLAVDLVCCSVTFGQKTIAEGTFQYDITIQSKSGNNASTGALQGAGTIFYVKGVYSRSDMISSLGNEKTIHDARQGTAIMLKEYSGQKLMITLTRENWKEKNKRSEGIHFTDGTETRQIAGYTCFKTMATLNDGAIINAYYTRDLLVANREYNPLFRNLNGVPLYYEVESGNLKFIYSLRSIDLATIPQSRFDLPKTGYRVISYDENKKEGRGEN